ncbi:variable surface protein [Plasmodium gonderi]|uniref:Variable surface protein n=1 Tax=Plasmodium gonderi TaxID=77519 RepID=A0A1Y1JL04_PLAGO|nr:variable surface protein [Plasmodium gonderi]GAW83206.1 variable surface protein [Plasmodium gonderi]
MGSNNHTTKDYAFDDIFPQCRNYYIDSKAIYNDSNAADLNKALSEECKKFITEDPHYTCGENYFLDTCIYLGRYLHYIESKHSEQANGKREMCRYFSYKLNQELRNFGCVFANTNVAYEKMINLRHSYNGDKKTFSDVCKDNIDNLDEDILHIFHYLDKLYETIENIQNYHFECNYHINLYERYREYLIKSQFINNESFNKVLQNAERDYNIYKKNMKDCKDYSHILPIFPRTVINHWLGVSTGMCILPLAIILIIFMMYKYTPYGYYLNPWIRKFKRVFKRKIKERVNLIKSFERTYKNSNYRNHLIFYTSEQYY